MVKEQFHLYAPQGEIISKVYPQSRLPKSVPKYDVIRLTARNGKGEFIDCFVYPQEAVLIAAALLRAYVYCVHTDKDGFKPNKKRTG